MINYGSIYLCAIEERDLPILLEWRNREDFRQYFREYRELSLKQQEEWYNRLSGSSDTLMFAIRGKASQQASGTGLLLGAAGLTYIKWKDRQAELSFYIGDRGTYLDEKYAKDSLRALLRYGFLELCMHKLWSECYITDGKRIALCQAHDFHQDGVLRHNAYKGGGWHDSYIYSMLDYEYAVKSHKWTE